MRKPIGKGSIKAVIAGGLAICLFSGLFIAANKYVFAKAMDKPVNIPVSYQEMVTKPAESPEYTKADFAVVQNNLLPSTNTNAMPAEEAAEIGARYLWDIFKTDLNGKVIFMSFTIDPSRAIAYWHGDVYANEKSISDIATVPEYGFSIEAISGERDTAICSRIKDDVVADTIPYKSSEADAKYGKNCEEYLEMAKELAKYQLPVDPVKAEYAGTIATLAPGYEFIIPEGKTATMLTDTPMPEDPNTIKVSPDDAYEATHVFIDILVTDANGNQVMVEFDVASKNVVSLHRIYKGIDYDPNSVG